MVAQGTGTLCPGCNIRVEDFRAHSFNVHGIDLQTRLAAPAPAPVHVQFIDAAPPTPQAPPVLGSATRCEACSVESRVIDSRRDRNEYVLRRRECPGCGERWSTYEVRIK